MGDLQLLGHGGADALAQLGELARLLGHDRVAERLGVDEGAERAAVGEVDRSSPTPGTSTGASRWVAKDGTFSNVTRSQRPSRQSARTRTSPAGASSTSSVTGSVIGTIPVSSSTVAVLIVFEPDMPS